MIIEIQDLKFKAILGILDFEREQSQEIIVNVTIEYLYDNEFINYADVADLIKVQMKKQKFLLIEDALTDLSQKLKEKFTKINHLHLKITKPSILPDCLVSVADSYNFNS